MDTKAENKILKQFHNYVVYTPYYQYCTGHIDYYIQKYRAFLSRSFIIDALLSAARQNNWKGIRTVLKHFNNIITSEDVNKYYLKHLQTYVFTDGDALDYVLKTYGIGITETHMNNMKFCPTYTGKYSKEELTEQYAKQLIKEYKYGYGIYNI